MLGDGQRDYHYGMAPQGEVQARLIVGDRVSLDTTFREYYISRVAATESTGSEDISRVDTALTFRVYNLHGITLAIFGRQPQRTLRDIAHIAPNRRYLQHWLYPTRDIPASAPSIGGPARKNNDTGWCPGRSAVHNIDRLWAHHPRARPSSFWSAKINCGA